MAPLACSVCHEVSVGKLYGFYLTVIKDGIRMSRRLRVCDRDLELLVNNYGRKWSDGFILQRFGEVSTCCMCGEERGTNGTLHPMYVTAYSVKGSRYDYYASYCSPCATALIDTFELEEVSRDR